jgi:hypothetical protein
MLSSDIPTWFITAIATAWLLRNVVTGFFNIIFTPSHPSQGPEALR